MARSCIHTTYNNVTGAMYVNTNVHVTTPDKLDSLLLVSTQNRIYILKAIIIGLKLAGW